MKSTLSTLSKYGATFCGLMALFTLALYLSCLISSDLLYANIERSYISLINQSHFPVLIAALDVKNDNVAESTLLNELVSVDATHPFESAMKLRKNYKPGYTTREVGDIHGASINSRLTDDGEEVVETKDFDSMRELGDFLRGNLHISYHYARYWQGFYVLYRPLFIFFHLNQVRLVLLAAFIALYWWFYLLVKRRFGPDISAIYGLSFLFSGYFTVAFSLQNAALYLTMIVSAIYYVKRLDKMRDFNLFVFVVACISNYLDFLTVPLLTLGVLCSLHILKLLEDGRDWSFCLKSVIYSSIAWLLGYTATWFGKWLLFDFYLKDNFHMVMLGIQQCIFRMSRQCEFDTPYGNNYLMLTIIILGRSSLFTLISAALLLYQRNFTFASNGFRKTALPFLLIATYPAIWHLTLANHTIFHYFFTYRLNALFIIGLLLAFYEICLCTRAGDAEKRSVEQL